VAVGVDTEDNVSGVTAVVGGGVAIISRLELGGDISAESFISGVVVVDGTVVGTVDGVDTDVEYVLKSTLTRVANLPRMPARFW